VISKPILKVKLSFGSEKEEKYKLETADIKEVLPLNLKQAFLTF